MNALALRIYAALMWLVQPLLRLKLARRARREPGYAEAIGERFGHYPQPVETHRELVWLHAVSLGETRTAAALLKALRAAQPGLRVLLTHGTATGRAEGKGLLAPGDVQVWQPWDSEAAVARFFDHFKPRLGLLMETEVWPCLVAAADARDVPLLLVNARLSEKSLQQALRMGPLALPAFAALKQVYAQTFEDAARFSKVGVAVAGVFGNLKFDAEPDAAQLAQGRAWRAEAGVSVLMFASSREGEEDEFFKQFIATRQALRAQAAMESGANADSRDAASGSASDHQPQAESTPASTTTKLLVVPRHPQRFDAVEALAQQHGLRVSRRSSWVDGPGRLEQAMQADVWLGDSLGEMARYYGLADVALLGGSFEPLGGQNLIEAAACSCPVVMGPHTFNFLEAAELAKAAGAALRVADMREGLQTGLRLLDNPGERGRAAEAGRAFAGQHRGATGRTLAAMQAYL
jgi:3-deoxy-D-manno-octulosonic-acid transferase